MISYKPLFICGHIKSGTSLLLSLFDGHSELLTFPEELFFFNKLNYLEKRNLSYVKDFWDHFFSDIQIRRLFGDEQQGLFGNVDYSDFDGEAFEELCKRNTKGLDIIKGNEMKIIEAIFVSYAEVTGLDFKLRWIEKTPTNEYNYFRLKEFFPDSQFLYLRRNPIEVYAAVKKKRQKEGVQYDVSKFLYNYYRSVKVADYLALKFPESFIIVDFEELLIKQKLLMMELCTFLNISYEEVLTIPTKAKKEWLGNSMFNDNSKGKIVHHPHVNRSEILDEFEKYILTSFYEHDNQFNFITISKLFFKYPFRAFRLVKQIVKFDFFKCYSTL